MSHWGSLCEPCGDCRWCRQNFKARRNVRQLRRELRTLRLQLAAAASAIGAELSAAGAEEVRSHPTLRAKARLLGAR